jgi:hypothetical protein
MGRLHGLLLETPAMTPLTQSQKYALRVRIAELCGDEATSHDWDQDGPVIECLTCGVFHYWNDAMRSDKESSKCVGTKKDYPSSLDAMHEAEKTLSREQCNSFNVLLMDGRPPRAEMSCEAEKWSWHATSEQRAIAFCLAMDNRLPWEDAR